MSARGPLTPNGVQAVAAELAGQPVDAEKAAVHAQLTRRYAHSTNDGAC